MIKILKLQKAVIAFVLGVLALIVYKLLNANKVGGSNYVLSLSGVFFVAGALMFLYPIVFAKKDKEGCVELEPEKQEEMEHDGIEQAAIVEKTEEV